MITKRVARVVMELEVEEVYDFIETVKNPKFDGQGMLREMAKQLENALYSEGGR